MKQVKVKKEELLDRLLVNRANHKAKVDDAIVGYKKLVREKLEEMLADANKNKVVALYELASIRMPMDMTEEYDKAIAMLEMSVEDEIIITSQEFSNFVQDNWDWSHTFHTTNSAYYSSI